jgi:hypothetical protein
MVANHLRGMAKQCERGSYYRAEFNKAADEIDRLRARVTDLEAELRKVWPNAPALARSRVGELPEPPAQKGG